MKRAFWSGRMLLVVGCAVGIVLGFIQALGVVTVNAGDNQNTNIVATVDQHDIRLLDYLRGLKLLDADKREALTEADARLVLDRMIEEELLLQYALQQNIARQPHIRTLVQQAVLDSVMNNVTARQPSEEELLAFYQHQIQPQIGGSAELVNGKLTPQWYQALEEIWADSQKSEQLEDYIAKLRSRAAIEFLPQALQLPARRGEQLVQGERKDG